MQKLVFVDGEWHDGWWFECEHREYLKTDYWLAFAKEIRTLRKYICERCGERGWHVHHLNYDRWPFRELADDVQLLCETCHKRAHGLI